MAEASSGSLNRSRGFKRLLWRSIKLSLLGIGYNDILPRLLGASDRPLLELSTYRIPSVLGRLGIASVVGALEAHLKLPPPMFPALLGALWYLIAGRYPLDPLSLTAQARLDRALFGSSHLYNPRQGFDPEGTLSSVLTAPVSLILGRYAARPSVLWTSETGQLAALGALAVLAVLLTSVSPFPSSKLLWTPTFVGQTAATSCLYWFLARGLVVYGGFLTDACEVVGQRTLEIYLISAAGQMGLDTLGAWTWIGNGLLKWVGLNEVWTGIGRSGMLALAMVPLAKVMVKCGWRLLR